MALINVQLDKDAPITQMDESELVKKKTIEIGLKSSVHATEYRLNDKLVHRSVNVILKPLN